MAVVREPKKQTISKETWGGLYGILSSLPLDKSLLHTKYPPLNSLDSAGLNKLLKKFLFCWVPRATTWFGVLNLTCQPWILNPGTWHVQHSLQFYYSIQIFKLPLAQKNSPEAPPKFLMPPFQFRNVRKKTWFHVWTVNRISLLEVNHRTWKWAQKGFFFRDIPTLESGNLIFSVCFSSANNSDDHIHWTLGCIYPTNHLTIQ